MIKEIKNNLYKVRVYYGGVHFIECDNLKELFKYLIVNFELKGFIISNVNEILPNGASPKVAVKTNKEYKKLLKELSK